LVSNSVQASSFVIALKKWRKQMNTNSNSLTTLSTMIAGTVLSLYGFALIANVILGG
jgi:hypothetical protein